MSNINEKFYGSEYADILPINPNMDGPKSLMDMFHLLQQTWCAETCAPRMRDKWTKDCPTLGQCSVTAFLVQDYFGGKVYGIPLEEGGVHCYNVIQGQTFDLTSSQFEEGSLQYQDSDPEQSREEHFQSAEKQGRYQLLKNRVLYLLGIRVAEKKKEEEKERFLLSFEELDRGLAKMLLEPVEKRSDSEKRPVLEKLLLKYPNHQDLLCTKAGFLYEDGMPEEAIKIFTDVYRKSRDDIELMRTIVAVYLNMSKVDPALQTFQSFADQGKFEQYDFANYARSLLVNGKESDASRILRLGINQYRKTLISDNPLSTTELLALGIREDFRKSPENTVSDIRLLKQLLMCYQPNDLMQDVLCDTIVLISTNLDKKWLRPVFLDFVNFVDNSVPLREELVNATIRTAYTALESWEYNEDPNISYLPEKVMSSIRYHAPEIMPSEQDKEFPDDDLELYRQHLTCRCYLCLMWDELGHEFDPVPTKYPHTWKEVGWVIEKIRDADEREVVFHEWLDELKSLLPQSEWRDLEKNIRRLAPTAAHYRERPVDFSSGYGTYKRSGPKIGPNDPCPCGSGRKYIKCCGKVS